MGNQFETEIKNRDMQIAQLTAAKKRNELIFLIAGTGLLLVIIIVRMKKKQRKKQANFLDGTKFFYHPQQLLSLKKYKTIAAACTH